MSVEVAAKDPDVIAEYVLDFEDVLVNEATRDTPFAAGVVTRPQRATGFYLECTTAGRTSAFYPATWPRADGETVQDGSLVWTCRHPSNVSLPSVLSATWDVPAGLTLESQSQSGFRCSITLSGGTDGEDYEVTCRMTPTVGQITEQTILVPVRSL